MAHLSNLAVAPSAQRRGLGRRLLAAAEEQAAAWGCRSVALHVDPTNTAAVAVSCCCQAAGVLTQRLSNGTKSQLWQLRTLTSRSKHALFYSPQQLYESAGFRRAVTEPALQAMLEGRPQPLVLMIRRLRSSRGRLLQAPAASAGDWLTQADD